MNDSVTNEYFSITKNYINKYGEKTILLMQVGAFFEMYGIKDDEGNVYPTHKNSIVKIGFICIEAGKFDENGEQIKAPKYAEKYSVDVLWQNYNLSDDDDSENYVDLDYILWDDYEINIDDQGVHRFMGVDYIP